MSGFVSSLGGNCSKADGNPASMCQVQGHPLRESSSLK